eukprot:g10135.t1
MANGVKPIYKGEWKNGKRHGYGELRWEQDNSDRQRKTFGDRQFSGVRKVYEGEFEYDLFSGQGTMRLEKAVSHPGRVPLPNLDPVFILSFEGTWASDWYMTDEEARVFSPLYDNLHQKEESRTGERKAKRDLDLDKVSPVQMKRRDQKFARYFSTDPLGVQAAGDPLPDLALAYYQQKGGDANHMQKGTARYADFTEYIGEYVRGVPGGKGKMTQYDHRDGKQGATFFVKWSRIESESHLHTMMDTGSTGSSMGKGGTAQKMDWSMKATSKTISAMATEELAPKLGYSKYEGQWQRGLFHGEGKLTYGDPDGDMSRLVFEGKFVDGKRTGTGRVFDFKPDGEKRLKLLCSFENDKIITSKKDNIYAWACFDGPGKYFYGLLGQEGDIGVWGTMYSARAEEDPDFIDCMTKGLPYQKENPEEEDVKYILYHGQWKDSVPDGFGVQHFEGAVVHPASNPMNGAHGGTYTGDFVKGKRHGRGVWKTMGGGWEFRPIANEDVPNWENDLMHGIGIVEDSEHVHENVIYTKGKCQMPFTELGPPKTGDAWSDAVAPSYYLQRLYQGPPLRSQEDDPLSAAVPCSVSQPLSKQSEIQVVSNDFSFAMVNHATGLAECWGDVKYGGDCSGVNFAGVRQVKANSRSMAVLTSTGGSCWGYTAYGGDCSTIGLSGMTELHSTDLSYLAFDAVGKRGICWGHSSYAADACRAPLMAELRSGSGAGSWAIRQLVLVAWSQGQALGRSGQWSWSSAMFAAGHQLLASCEAPPPVPPSPAPDRSSARAREFVDARAWCLISDASAQLQQAKEDGGSLKGAMALLEKAHRLCQRSRELEKQGIHGEVPFSSAASCQRRFLILVLLEFEVRCLEGDSWLLAQNGERLTRGVVAEQELRCFVDEATSSERLSVKCLLALSKIAASQSRRRLAIHCLQSYLIRSTGGSDPDFEQILPAYREILSLHACRNDCLEVFDGILNVLKSKSVNVSDEREKPCDEIQWLVATAWNNGAHFFRLQHYRWAEEWMKKSLALAKFSPGLPSEKMTEGYMACLKHCTPLMFGNTTLATSGHVWGLACPALVGTEDS